MCGIFKHYCLLFTGKYNPNSTYYRHIVLNLTALNFMSYLDMILVQVILKYFLLEENWRKQLSICQLNTMENGDCSNNVMQECSECLKSSSFIRVNWNHTFISIRLQIKQDLICSRARVGYLRPANGIFVTDE